MAPSPKPRALRTLVPADLEAEFLGDAEVLVTGVTHASTEVVPGDLFVCVPGARADGHDFAPAAIGAGAVALVVERGLDVPVVTNVGLAHMEVFGSWDAIVRAGVEPVRALPPHGTAVLNADDAVVRGYADLAPCRVLTFGVASDADVRASDVVLDDDGVATFDLEVGRDSERIRLSVPGAHMVSNALAAGAVGIALGIDAAACAIALKGARVSRWRMEVSERPDGVRIVNDAYNANPESMIAGVKAARVIARGRRLVLVLGHMAELGPISMEEHERLGRLLVRIGIERLVTVGPEAEAIARAAIREGQLPEDVAVCADPESATAEVRGWIRPGDVVFLKGSRVAGLERVAEALR